jgi:outer membrane protein OmpA-like peptidoglycan-associated protein
MKRMSVLIQNGSDMFGPGTDLIISLVAVMLIMFSLKSIINIEIIRKNQLEVVKKISKTFMCKNEITSNKLESEYEIITSSGLIKIIHNVKLQKFTFGSNILFAFDSSTLNNAGKEVLRKVFNVFQNKLDNIVEIQIQGHADIVGDDNYNLELAADRAVSVYKFFQKDLKFKPEEQVMSITSFGKYMPVMRTKDKKYSKELLKDHNSGKYKSLNRRIEILLFYDEKKL